MQPWRTAFKTAHIRLFDRRARLLHDLRPCRDLLVDETAEDDRRRVDHHIAALLPKTRASSARGPGPHLAARSAPPVCAPALTGRSRPPSPPLAGSPRATVGTTGRSG